EAGVAGAVDDEAAADQQIEHGHPLGTRAAGAPAGPETRRAADVTADGPPPIWLPGQDSNLQPRGYKAPRVSAGLGLSHPRGRPTGVAGGAGWGRVLPPVPGVDGRGSAPRV